MNHDYTHCLDYDGGKCPLSCYRAEVTRDLEKRREEFIGIPLSWAQFKGTEECLRVTPHPSAGNNGDLNPLSQTSV